MALFGMPLTVINLGGEMMYILEQRLIAQKIPPEKACKVRRLPLREQSDRVAASSRDGFARAPAASARCFRRCIEWARWSARPCRLVTRRGMRR
jgi:hypothetical protein